MWFAAMKPIRDAMNAMAPLLETERMIEGILWQRKRWRKTQFCQESARLPRSR